MIEQPIRMKLNINLPELLNLSQFNIVNLLLFDNSYSPVTSGILLVEDTGVSVFIAYPIEQYIIKLFGAVFWETVIEFPGSVYPPFTGEDIIEILEVKILLI